MSFNIMSFRSEDVFFSVLRGMYEISIKLFENLTSLETSKLKLDD